MRALIDEICETMGPRPSGGAEEYEAAILLQNKLDGWGVEATVERFRVGPRVLQTSIAACTVGYAIACSLYFVFPLLSFLLLSAVFVAMTSPRLLGRDPLEAVLPKKSSSNVLGRIKAAKKRKHLVIFSGHHDSAYRMPALRRQALYPLLTVLSVVIFLAVVTLWGLSLWRTVTGAHSAPTQPVWESYFLWFCTGSAILALLLAAGMLRGDAVLGANDNLSAVAVAWEVARRLAASPPEHVEVWIASYGSEEAGLKGSRAFVAEHHDELENAIVVNMECLGQSGTLHALTGELITLTRHSKEAVALVEEAAADASVPVKRLFLLPGLTDATSFSRRGISATTIIRFNDAGYLDHYHNPEDAPASISEESLQQALSLCLAVVDKLDGSS